MKVPFHLRQKEEEKIPSTVVVVILLLLSYKVRTGTKEKGKIFDSNLAKKEEEYPSRWAPAYYTREYI
jgi:hypothetical protein